MTEKELSFVYQQQKEITLLNNASSILGWDQQTYMPKEGTSVFVNGYGKMCISMVTSIRQRILLRKHAAKD